MAEVRTDRPFGEDLASLPTGLVRNTIAIKMHTLGPLWSHTHQEAVKANGGGDGNLAMRSR
eukprot:1138071-Pelagomonas_calceolata.AAC.2